ncbi:MAG: hypothetical protein CXR30_08305 [Geobacter sp.]|nr:MAG: hypothetical protein CXR30_08305 [Geobacter sp.]
MKRTFLAALMVILAVALVGCGSSGGGPTTVTTQILSAPTLDGDIAFDSTANSYTVTQGMSPTVQSVFAGIDPVTNVEYRAFLDFPLTGTGGVPGNALIASAVLDIVINSINPQPLVGTIPIRIDLVSFTQPMVNTDFDRTLQPALVTTTVIPPISQADFGQHVTIDVTSLMAEAQRLGLANFQIRIMEDLGVVSPGLIEISDPTLGTNPTALAPLLQVTYY